MKFNATDIALINAKKDIIIDQMEGRIAALNTEKEELQSRINELVEVNDELIKSAESTNPQ